MASFSRTFKVRPGEERLVVLQVGLMFFVYTGSAIGVSAINALFFSRFGAEHLPFMYLALGGVSSVTLLGMSALLGRFDRERMYVFLPAVLAGVLVSERALLMLGSKWIYPVLWLSMNLIWTLQLLFCWGLAGSLTETRQAKRLFPLFSAGGILGTISGGLVTQPVARLLHTENLILVWGGFLLIAFLFGYFLFRTGTSEPRLRKPTRRKSTHLMAELSLSARYIRQSQLLKWVLVSGVLFSILLYSLALPFAKSVAAQIPDEEALAGFLGRFQGFTTAAALLASIFFANRLFTRFGIMTGRIGLAVIYMLGFSTLAVYPAFSAMVVFRFAELAWSQGVSNPAYQAIFNLIPVQRREQVRTFISAIPDQAGTIIAGLILATGQQFLQPRDLYIIALLAAILATVVVGMQIRAYRSALVEALHAGQPHLFSTALNSGNEDLSYVGFKQDGGAVSVVVAGMSNPDPAVRRVSAEILCQLPVPEAARELTRALADPDAQVRAAVLRALGHAMIYSAVLEIVLCLNDPEPEVRAQAVEALYRLSSPGQGLAALIRPLLADPQPFVRARAAAALFQCGFHPEALEALKYMVKASDPESRIQAMKALREAKDPSLLLWIKGGLQDPHSGVRRAAIFAYASTIRNMEGDRPASFADSIIQALGDADPGVRGSAAAAVGRIGPELLDPVVDALSDPHLMEGAIAALAYLPARRSAKAILRFARESALKALHYQTLKLSASRISSGHISGDSLELVIDSLDETAQRYGVYTLSAVGLLGDWPAANLAIRSLKSKDPNQRANAIETLESIGEREIVHSVLPLWERGEVALPTIDEWMVQILADPDPWLRACAAQAAYGSTEPQIRTLLIELAEHDEDATVRRTATLFLQKGEGMEILPTISLIERVLFLRKVSLFAGLPPSDLREIAAVVEERYYVDGDQIVEEGEPGDVMFIITSGQVRIIKTVAGRVIEVAQRGPGDVVGEMSIISHEPRTASLVASGNVRVLCLDQENFETMLIERPQIGLAVMRELIAMLKESPATMQSNGFREGDIS